MVSPRCFLLVRHGCGEKPAGLRPHYCTIRIACRHQVIAGVTANSGRSEVAVEILWLRSVAWKEIEAISRPWRQHRCRWVFFFAHLYCEVPLLQPVFQSIWRPAARWRNGGNRHGEWCPGVAKPMVPLIHPWLVISGTSTCEYTACVINTVVRFRQRGGFAA